jgi:hypothetical protein
MQGTRRCSEITTIASKPPQQGFVFDASLALANKVAALTIKSGWLRRGHALLLGGVMKADHL